GQKNHNLLRGIAAVDRLKPDCYAFCDSTHLAKPNFLRALVQPIARLETRFSTGYHEVVAKDQSLTSLGYAISVLFMRHLQALSVFTQPWGGAMAITRSTFIKAKIGERWSNTVVDDCSLVSYLKEKHIHVELAASALLKTEVENYQPPVWQAWMERKILFPRYCVPLQWWLLGVMLMLMLMPPLLIFEDLVLVLKQGHLLRALLPCGFFVLYFGLIWRLSSYLAWYCSKLKFIGAFFLALWTFLREYIGTFWSQNIYWQGILYKVGRGGIVLESHKIDE
ncbi:MAG: glycosyltransferase, partial [Desulfovibrionaceae bacterium]|nr:glycosyltransferase [Desulfovibrionaceae bacterium]